MRGLIALVLLVSLTSTAWAADPPAGEPLSCQAPVVVPIDPGLPECPEGRPCVAQGLLRGDVSPATIHHAVEFIRQANARHVRAIVLEINSPGGSVDDGFLLAKAIESSDAPVMCVVDGEAASMAFYILQSCASRLMTFRSVLMAHDVRLEGPPSKQTETDLKNELDEVRAFSRAYAEQVSRRMGMSYQNYSRRVAHGRDWYMHYGQALKVHAVDQVVSSVTEGLAMLADELALAP